ncbi:zinc dependent phospholipase C family protein [Senegalia massiliensis]|uniref:Phospholipase C n=1 Tax=Senegalia massiliensis TaxID=1720316 RepID=A0A845QVJ9_9CLOT|nr:zinc dependent phospholipase C family protein [Senegalia massiliensis]NBI05819.1 phospholipase [Senegalia massiliensis]
MNRFEKYYGMAFKSVLWALNPFKKKIITTECKVHRFINYQSMKLLADNNYIEEFEVYNHYLEEVNRGAVWADQDFKSTSHFYSPTKRRGMFGHSNAKNLTNNYYKKAISYWKKGYKSRSMFYLGASLHIIQDMTIPQHVNIRLLDNHRQYENFVKTTYDIVKEFRTSKSPIEFKKLNSYIVFNAKTALKQYKKYKDLENSRERYYKITKCSLPLAQRTTAGCMIKFLKDVKYYDNKNNIN